MQYFIYFNIYYLIGNKSYEMIMDKQSIAIIGNTITYANSELIPTELRKLGDQVLLQALDFISDVFEGLKISSFFNIKELFIKHPIIGLQSITKLLTSQNRHIQIASMKILIEYATFCQSREWIDSNKIDPAKLLGIKSDDDSILSQCLRHQIVRFSAIASFPYDKSTSTIPIPKVLSTPTKTVDETKLKTDSQDGSATVTAVKPNRRGRRKWAALQQITEQPVTPIPIPTTPTATAGMSDALISQIVPLEGITDADDEKREEILTDFIMTESSYVSDLNKVIWLYFKPLYHIQITRKMNENTKVMNEFIKLYSLMEYIINYSTAFLNVIENRFS